MKKLLRIGDTERHRRMITEKSVMPMGEGNALRLIEIAVEVVIGNENGIVPDRLVANRSIPLQNGIVRPMEESTGGSGHIHRGASRLQAAAAGEVTTDLVSAGATMMITVAKLHVRLRRGNLRHLRQYRVTVGESTIVAAVAEGALAAEVGADMTTDAIRLRHHHRSSSRTGAGVEAAIDTRMIAIAAGTTSGSQRRQTTGVLRVMTGGVSTAAGGVDISSPHSRSPENGMTILEAGTEIHETATSGAKSLMIVVHADVIRLPWVVLRHEVVAIQ